MEEWSERTTHSIVDAISKIRKIREELERTEKRLKNIIWLNKIEKEKNLKSCSEEDNKNKNKIYGPHDFVQTSPCGRGEHHPSYCYVCYFHGLVGNLWRINDPNSVRVGDCFLNGRLKKGDLFLCIRHDGDCFQYYMYVSEASNCLTGKPIWTFGSYGIGDAKRIDMKDGEFEILKNGGYVEREWYAELSNKNPDKRVGSFTTADYTKEAIDNMDRIKKKT
jgi:hypothetical protein